MGEHKFSHCAIAIIRTDGGLEGVGEANAGPRWSGESQAGALAAIKEILAPALLGRDPLHISDLSARMDRELVGNPFARASLEMALFDLAGKALRVPAGILLGGPRRSPEIPLRFSIGAFTPEKAAHVAESAAAQGLRAVKVKVGLDVAGDIERVRAVRRALGDGFPVGVDANAGWRENEALAAIPHLEHLGINVIEEPVRRGDFRSAARLRRRTRIPIMLDESIFTAEDAINAIRFDACDIVSIYPGKNGGIARSFQIAVIAAAAGLECTIGSNLEWEFGSAAMLHLAVAIPNLSQRVCHDIIGPLYHTRHVGTELKFGNGCARVPDGVGLGIELDRSCLQ
ncbi:MAG: mandelate racemase/muconate lactonizing enzyme family protein [Terriglobia bacterium]